MRKKNRDGSKVPTHARGSGCRPTLGRQQSISTRRVNKPEIVAAAAAAAVAAAAAAAVAVAAADDYAEKDERDDKAEP